MRDIFKDTNSFEGIEFSNLEGIVNALSGIEQRYRRFLLIQRIRRRILSTVFMMLVPITFIMVIYNLEPSSSSGIAAKEVNTNDLKKNNYLEEGEEQRKKQSLIYATFPDTVIMGEMSKKSSIFSSFNKTPLVLNDFKAPLQKLNIDLQINNVTSKLVKGEYEEAKKLLKVILENPSIAENQQAKIQSYLGDIAITQANPITALAHYETAQAIYNQRKEGKLNLAFTYIRQGFCYLMQDSLQKSLNAHYTALKIVEKLDLRDQLFNFFARDGLNQLKNNKPLEAYIELKKWKKECKKMEFYHEMLYSDMALGLGFKYVSKNKKALKQYKKIRENQMVLGYEIIPYYTYLLQSITALKMKDFKEAIFYAELSEKILNRLENDKMQQASIQNQQIVVNYIFTQANFELNDFPAVRKSLENVEKTIEKLTARKGKKGKLKSNENILVLLSYRTKAQTLECQGKFHSALRYYDRALSINKNLDNGFKVVYQIQLLEAKKALYLKTEDDKNIQKMTKEIKKQKKKIKHGESVSKSLPGTKGVCSITK